MGLDYLLLHISRLGIPGGVGMSRNPPVYLRPGNTIRLEVEGLGVQQQTVTAE